MFCDVAMIADFECPTYFPAKIEALIKAAETDWEVNDTRLIYKAEVTGMIANLKDLVVMIENAELIGQSQTFHDATAECESLNEEIGKEYAKRIGKDGSRAERQRVNVMIEKFTELRKGNPRNSQLQLSRKELQPRHFKKLVYLLKHGHQITAQQES